MKLKNCSAYLCPHLITGFISPSLRFLFPPSYLLFSLKHNHLIQHLQICGFLFNIDYSYHFSLIHRNIKGWQAGMQ